MSFFNHIPINFQQAELIEKDDAHYYQTPNGDIYPSITTILHKTMPAEKQQSLQNWKEQEVAAPGSPKHSGIGAKLEPPSEEKNTSTAFRAPWPTSATTSRIQPSAMS